ncbi:reverse transcriptase-like protein [Sphingosinicella sp. BN140058]|uniref:reverse transcriptase-like protein n=1 Tax=Sphingosinicella sp. BN140058 TaxID=1892855 RepID=UPI0010107493|nr:reverse transcriptase-like protein [Sphingosinicella sp. BN140058]QAY77569.1 reverse transcriptase-like protein [Sphingosinicella sp. BN140058]
MKIFFDGGCHPNPGTIDVAVVLRGQSHIRTTIATGDNNDAEWRALLFALELALAAGLDDVRFVGDSKLVIDQAAGRLPCRSAHLRDFCDEFRTRAAAIPRLRLTHVRRAQNLAGIALDAARWR